MDKPELDEMEASVIKETKAAHREAQLEKFVAESNRIEGIHREPTIAEITAHDRFLARPSLDLRDVEMLVAHLQPGAKLRGQPGMDVRVGLHLPPPGGPEIPKQLEVVLLGAHPNSTYSPWEIHVAYETLHPFMDGNGRSGRAIWAWMMLKQGNDPFTLGFLHTAYYQALEAGR